MHPTETDPNGTPYAFLYLTLTIQRCVLPCSEFSWLVVGEVFLKLCFQVFIVLSPADEAGACRVHEGACSGCGIDDL
jgi:hypothetical protein